MSILLFIKRHIKGNYKWVQNIMMDLRIRWIIKRLVDWYACHSIGIVCFHFLHRFAYRSIWHWYFFPVSEVLGLRSPSVTENLNKILAFHIKHTLNYFLILWIFTPYVYYQVLHFLYTLFPQRIFLIYG